jgi:hypothetical protein
MEAGAVILFLILLAFGTFWLGIYCYLLYQAGRKLAERFRVKIGPKLAAVIFGCGAAVIAAPIGWLELDIIYKSCLIFGIWLIHAEPISVGYWAGVEIGHGDDLQRWEEKTDQWLADWEEAAPSCMKNWED